MEVLMIEPLITGHRLPYVAWILKGLSEHELSIRLVINSKAKNHPSIINLIEYIDNKNNITIETFHEYNLEDKLEYMKYGGLVSQFTLWLVFRRLYRLITKKHKTSFVFIPYLDYILYSSSLLGSPFKSSCWSGIIMGVFFHQKKMGVISDKPQEGLVEKIFFKMMKNKKLKKIYTIDETFKNYIDTRLENNKVQTLMEPIGFSYLPDRNTSRNTIGLSDNKLTVLVYGGLSMRKGIIELLDVIDDKNFPENICVIFAGKLDNEVRKLFLKK